MTNTIWRLTEEDFLSALEDYDVSSEQKEAIIESAYERFNIDLELNRN